MRRPLGAKVAAILEVAIFLLMLTSFMGIQDMIKMADESLPRISWDGASPFLVMQEDTMLLDAIALMSYAILVVGAAHLVLALLLWQGNTLGRYVASAFAVLDLFIMLPTLLLSVPILFLIWLHKDTEPFYR